MFVCMLTIRGDDLPVENVWHSALQRHRSYAQPEHLSSSMGDPPDYGDAWARLACTRANSPANG